MVNFSVLERIFYAIGSLVALILGAIELKRFLEPPNIMLRPYLFFKNKERNEYGQEVIPLQYEFRLLNTGREIVGEVLLSVGGFHVIHSLSEVINLKKNTPYMKEGIVRIEPVGVNIKKIETPFKVKIFFQDVKKKKYAVHEITLHENGAGWQETKASF
ncbi:MAG TPA: hypothetical protein PKJ54_00755 [Candidatus Pacearchaeota archaeon]|nr:hypothetical protein [Candidatus Pacearchaeota archaeon]